MSRHSSIAKHWLLITVATLPIGANAVDFATEVRPILSDKCFLCHGPAEASREAELRLDLADSATEDRGGYAAIVSGDPDESEAIVRILSDDDSMQMPPPESGKSLTPEEIETLKAWIREGAEWSAHWAFVAPQRPAVPEVPSDASDGWSSGNPIDAFVLRKLRNAGLAPSPRADSPTRLRRLYLDLVGLPPTLDERKAFLIDTSAEAYARQVEALLESPHYGERWGRRWLDAARYSDSDGYEKDMRRDNWFYRDWVVDALNADMPYDDFVVAQIAGDLMPDAEQDERVATGFLRNSMVNEEGGADPEQFRVEGLFDRMDAIGKAVLGLTTQCAQCHTHKYDPLTHHDYFGLFAYLNNDHEAILAAYTLNEQRTIDQIRDGVAAIEAQLKQAMPDWRKRIAAWVDEQRERRTSWRVLTAERDTFTGQKFEFLPDGSIISRSYAPPRTADIFLGDPDEGTIRAIRFELLNHPDLPRGGPGRSIYGTSALSEFQVEAIAADGTKVPVPVASATASLNISARPIGEPFVKADAAQDDRTVGPIEFAIDGDNKTAWTTLTGPAERNQPREAVFILEEPLEITEGMRLRITLQQQHGGFVGNQKNNNLAGRFRFSVTDAEDATADGSPAVVREAVQRDTKAWSERDWGTLFSHWRTTRDEWQEANDKIEALRSDYPEGTNQYVVLQRETPRVTRRMDRGDFLSPDELVEPHTPDFLHAVDGLQNNRLGLARWLVHRRSPTTARAVVNRVWQAYFGTGIVETAEDLGSQAPPPSHPELLDWLAVEFMDSGWSLKRLHRLIVTSATYQQASSIADESAEKDPYNRLLWRGPRGRVEAEVVRDTALAASGLLDRTLGGPSVYPPAPRFLFLPPTSYGVKLWNTVEGSSSYRRSLYVQAYRSSPYPPLQVFDAPNGESSCVRRSRSNTPLQALTMLNEQQFVSCSRSLGRRLAADAEATDEQRIAQGYRLLLARDPDEEETRIVLAFLNRSRQRLAAGDLEAPAIVGRSGDEDAGDSEELAAWTLAARCLLNLDETITKQ